MSDKSAVPLTNRLRILDLTRNIAGPYATKLFAEIGADVIKIESPGEGDPARSTGPFFTGGGPYGERSSVFHYLNTSKKSITLNIMHSAGKKLFRKLLVQTDVVFEDFEVGFMKSLGLDYGELCKTNPGLVMTSITNFGQTGRYKDWKSSDLVAFAMSGVSYSSFGSPERNPIKPYGSIGMHAAGLYAAVGTMIALHSRERTLLGQHVDISLLECVASLDAHQIPMLSYEHEKRRRNNVINSASHPMTNLRCKDGYVSFGITTPAQWQRLGAIAGLPDGRFVEETPAVQRPHHPRHSEHMKDAIEPWLLSHTRDEIEKATRDIRISASGVRNMAEVMSGARHGFMREMAHPFAGNVTFPGLPFRTSSTRNLVNPAPTLGEHNEEVFCQRLGYSHEQITRLRGLGTI